MGPAELEDIQLMGRVAAGDQGAFSALYERHAPIVLGVLIRMLKRRDEAEEILQEVFLQAWDQAKRYSARRAAPRGWLLMLARSRAIDRIRSGRSRAQRETEVSTEASWSTEVEPVGTGRLEAGERSARVGRALGDLPSEQRRCIELAFFGGLSHTQIADRLEEPLGTVKSRIALGMRKLRQTLEPIHSEP